jgi:hypothetical protein
MVFRRRSILFEEVDVFGVDFREGYFYMKAGKFYFYFPASLRKLNRAREYLARFGVMDVEEIQYIGFGDEFAVFDSHGNGFFVGPVSVSEFMQLFMEKTKKGFVVSVPSCKTRYWEFKVRFYFPLRFTTSAEEEDEEEVEG